MRAPEPIRIKPRDHGSQCGADFRLGFGAAFQWLANQLTKVVDGVPRGRRDQLRDRRRRPHNHDRLAVVERRQPGRFWSITH